MRRWLRRVLWLSALAGVGYGGYQAWNRKRAAAPPDPQWPPLRTDPVQPSPSVAAEPTSANTTDTTAAVASEPAKWLPTVDGQCPDGYPLKANDNSRIFHSPGGRFYERTVAERCYARADDAIADGYRPAKA